MFKSQTREALELAHGMLVLIEGGASLTQAAWDERMGKIELALGIETKRSVQAAHERAAR